MATGPTSARIHGARAELLERAAAAHTKATEPRLHPAEAAALRGKAHAYREAADILRAISDGRRIPKRRAWTGWMPRRR